ncbi:MAG: 50S ribosomal protein L32 [Rickettsiales bacterium]|nr:50S ribosomal protein L32 [Rickettsiales bacterium]
MAVPKKKTSHSRKNMRRSHHALGTNTVGVCKSCGEPAVPHHVCRACGSYDGRKVVEHAQTVEGGAK